MEEVINGLKEGKSFVRMDGEVVEMVLASVRSPYWFHRNLNHAYWSSSVELHVSVLKTWDKDGWVLI